VNWDGGPDGWVFLLKGLEGLGRCGRVLATDGRESAPFEINYVVKSRISVAMCGNMQCLSEVCLISGNM
jgi:hypothetical protein